MIKVTSDRQFKFTWKCSCGYVHIEKMFESTWHEKRGSFKLTRPCQKCGKPNTALKKTYSISN